MYQRLQICNGNQTLYISIEELVKNLERFRGDIEAGRVTDTWTDEVFTIAAAEYWAEELS